MIRLKTKHTQTALYVILLLAVAAVMFMARRCSSAPPLPPLSQGGSSGDTLDVAIIYGPTSYYLYGDTLGGINYDMLRRFGKDTSTPVKFWPVVNLHDALNRLEKGSYDMLASLPSDHSVKQRFLTTESVFLDRLTLIQLSDSSGDCRVKSALDLANDTIHIQQDSPASSRINNLSNEIGDTIYMEKEEGMSEEYLCMMVATGKAGLAVVNEKTALKMQRQYPLLSIDNPISFTQFQVWLIPRQDTTLLHKTNLWIRQFRETPEYRNITGRF